MGYNCSLYCTYSKSGSGVCILVRKMKVNFILLIYPNRCWRRKKVSRSFFDFEVATIYAK